MDTNFFQNIQAKMAQLQQEYNSNLASLQQEAQNYRQMFNNPMQAANFTPQAQVSTTPAGPAVPPHIQQLTALGEIKSTLEKILEKISPGNLTEKTEVKQSKQQKDESIKA